MDFDEYKKFTRTTDLYPEHLKLIDYTLGLVSEVGEVAGKLKKYHRDGNFQFLDELKKELGDVLWYFARLCDFYAISLEEIIDGNVRKLTLRQKNGTLHGSGDNR